MSALPERHVVFDWIDAGGTVVVLFAVALIHILLVGGPAEWPTRIAGTVSVAGAHRLRLMVFGSPVKFVDRHLSALGVPATALIILGTLLAAGGLALAAFWKPAAPASPAEAVQPRRVESPLMCVINGQPKTGDECSSPEQREEARREPEIPAAWRPEALADERAREAERLRARHASRVQIFFSAAAAGLAMLVAGGCSTRVARGGRPEPSGTLAPPR